MYIDKLAQFADGADIAKATGTHLIGDVMDLTTARDIGNGTPIYAVITLDTDVDSSGDSANVEFVIASDDTASIATNGTATEHVSTGVIGEANLTAGSTFALTLPNEGNAYEQYVGMLIKVTGEATTAGAANAFLTCDPAAWKAYADALPAVP
jgi:hypothetical protein